MSDFKTPEQLADEAKALLAEVLPKLDELKPKDRMNLQAQAMPAQDPEVRRHNQNEVALGYTPEQAGMTLRQKPRRPNTWELLENGRSFPPNYLHESWRDYLYWDTELDQ